MPPPSALLQQRREREAKEALPVTRRAVQGMSLSAACMQAGRGIATLWRRRLAASCQLGPIWV